MAKKVVLTVGTKRGLFLLESTKGRKRWKVSEPLLKGWEILHGVLDTRSTPRLHVGAFHYAFGATTLSGTLKSRKLKPADAPPAFPSLNKSAAEFAEKYGLSTANKVWNVTPGPNSSKRVLYCGTAPAGLFRSEDNGKTWEPVSGLNDHETRDHWSPGAGGQSLHSIQMDPHDDQRMYAAISAAGAFRTDDGGTSWTPINAAVADYVGAPKESEVGT